MREQNFTFDDAASSPTDGTWFLARLRVTATGPVADGITFRPSFNGDDTLRMKPSALIAPEQSTSLTLSENAPAVGHGIGSRTLLATPELRVVLFTFAAGEALTEHTSTSRALIQILSGTGEFVIGGEARALKTGDFLHLPPRMPHAVNATTEMTMLLTLAPECKAIQP